MQILTSVLMDHTIAVVMVIVKITVALLVAIAMMGSKAMDTLAQVIQ